MAEMEAKRPRVEVDERSMGPRLEAWANSSGPDDELTLRENYGREGTFRIQSICQRLNMFAQSYGKGKDTVVVVAKRELPMYRAELDVRHGRKETDLYLSSTDAAAVEGVLGRFQNGQLPAPPPQNRVSSGIPAGGGVATSVPVAPFAGNPELDSWEDDDASEVCGNAMDASQPSHIQESPQVIGPARDPARDAILSETHKVRMGHEAGFGGLDVSIGGEGDGKGHSAMGIFASRRSLPAFASRNQVLAAIRDNSVVVVKGETGSGKTTQVAQYILECMDAEGCGSAASLICTQPRRLAATSVAERVASERGEKVGSTVGYQIRLESRRSEETRLLFCTTGVLLRRLALDPLLSNVSHVLVDEIHERGVNEDFLLVCLKDILVRRSNIKIVLMSATLNAEVFRDYFGSGTPLVEIPGITFPVRELWLEDLVSATALAIPNESEGRSGYCGREGGGNPVARTHW